MKVTIQNGAAHGLSRRDIEAIVPELPPSWAKHVKQIVLYQAKGSELTASYYPKEQIVGLFWPLPEGAISKAEGLRALLLALSVVDERGELPERLATSVRERHLLGVSELFSLCLALVNEDGSNKSVGSNTHQQYSGLPKH